MSNANEVLNQGRCCCCTEICFFPCQDAYIAEWYPQTNFGNVPYLYVSQYNCPSQPCPCPDDYRSLLKFDLCSLGCNYIPPNSEICYAYLQLSIYRNEVPCEIEICLHKVLAPWDESIVNWSNQPLIYPEPEDCNCISPGCVEQVCLDVSSLVRGWYSGCCANNGIMLIGNEQFNSLVGFYSSEFPNSLLWPKLVVGYVQKCCTPCFNGPV